MGWEWKLHALQRLQHRGAVCLDSHIHTLAGVRAHRQACACTPWSKAHTHPPWMAMRSSASRRSSAALMPGPIGSVAVLLWLVWGDCWSSLGRKPDLARCPASAARAPPPVVGFLISWSHVKHLQAQEQASQKVGG